MAFFRFRRWSENWLGQLWRELQSGWKLNPANALRLLIFFPTRTSQITAHDTLHRQRFRFPYNHRTPGQLFTEWPQFLWKLLKIRRDKVIIDLVEPLEPKRGNLVQHCALVWNWVGQDYVKRRDAIRDDEKQRVAEVKDLAHFSAAQFLDSGYLDRGLCRHMHAANSQRSTPNFQPSMIVMLSEVETSLDLSSRDSSTPLGMTD